MRVYAYLRASTKDQDVKRAKGAIDKFCKRNDLKVSAYFYENDSGAKLSRPELFKLIDIAERGDVLLVEQVDRISRLTEKDWKTLKRKIQSKGLRVVSLDLPTSHQLMKEGDKFTGWVLDAINGMMLDFLAAFSRKDYEDRRRRQREGIEKAKLEGKYKGRRRDPKLRANIASLLRDGKSYGSIVDLLSCSRATIASVKKELDESKIN